MIAGTVKIRWEPAEGATDARNLYLVPVVLDGGGQGWRVCDDATSLLTAFDTAYGFVWLHRARAFSCWAYRGVDDKPDARRGSQLADREAAAGALMFHLRVTGRLRPPRHSR